MKAVRIISGTAVPLRRSDVDTDQIIPAEWLKRVERTGFGAGLFASWRDDRSFILNHERHAGATILVAGANFGVGSSREHAVWALQDYGFDAVISPRFSDIFFNNCTKNGLLPIVLDDDVVVRLHDAIEEDPTLEVTIDLERLVVEAPAIGLVAPFTMDPATQRRFLEGLDDIGITLAAEDEIAAFEASRPAWLVAAEVPRGVGSAMADERTQGQGWRSDRGAGVDGAGGARAGPEPRRPAARGSSWPGPCRSCSSASCRATRCAPSIGRGSSCSAAASLIAAGVAIVGLIDGWAGAPLLALADRARRCGHRPHRCGARPEPRPLDRARLRPRIRDGVLASSGARPRQRRWDAVGRSPVAPARRRGGRASGGGARSRVPSPRRGSRLAGPRCAGLTAGPSPELTTRSGARRIPPSASTC